MSQLKITVVVVGASIVVAITTAVVAMSVALATSAPLRISDASDSTRDPAGKMLTCPSNNRAVLHSERKTG